MRAPINRIIDFSNVDGPGNRTSIFVQSCPFRCLFCHNPETMQMCMNCGACVQTCPPTPKALSMEEGKVVWNKDLCVACDTCIHTCPHLSSPKITWMSPQDVLQHLQMDLPFIEGITVSGGECTTYPEFLTELFQQVRALGKTCFLDSNGAWLYSSMPELMAVTDAVMLDVKAWDPEWHMELCGYPNDNVRANLLWLQEHHQLYEVRTVCLPDRPEENEETVRQTARHLDPAIRYKLIKYRPFGVRPEGLEKLGHSITSDEEIQRLKKAAEEEGCQNVIIV